MEIKEIRIMRGPNFWSEKNTQLIVMELDTSGSENLTPKDKSSFSDRVENLISLIGKRQKKQVIVDFAGENNDIASAILNIAITIQGLEKPNEAFAKLFRLNAKHLNRLVFSYEIEQAGKFAAETAVLITESLLREDSYDIMYDLDEMEDIKYIYGPGPTTGFILNEVRSQEIPYKRYGRSSLITLGYGIRQKKMRAAVADTTSALGLEIAGDKEETKDLLAEANVPVPKGILITDRDRLEEEVKKLRFPLVTKPLNGNHGRGVTTNIQNMEQLKFGWDIAKKIGEEIIIEEYIPGDDFRFLVLNYKLVAIAKRTPALVTGNGKSTIQELIEEVNISPLRGDGPEHILAPILIDATTKKILNQRKLSLETILPPGEVLILKDTANISQGGTSTDVTHLVHPENIFFAERIARLFNLNICGIDLIATDIGIPVTRDVGAVIEVNAGPGLRMHTDPNTGETRNVAKPIIEMLFPKPSFSWIPVVAISGSEKKTTAKIINDMAMEAGYKSGHAGEEGIVIQGHLLSKEDSTHYDGGKSVLFDPSIDFAVLECDESDIWRNGVPFNKCDISIITGDAKHDKRVPSDIRAHKLAAVVARCTAEEGYAILNADDEFVDDLLITLKCNIALFSRDPDSEKIKKHKEEGGIAAVIEKNEIVIYQGQKREVLPSIHVNGGKDGISAIHFLPAALVGFIRDFRETDIVESLKKFI